MKDHEKRELVSELVGIASIAHGTEQLRDRIAYALSGVFSAIDGVTGRAENAESELAQKLEKAEAELARMRAVNAAPNEIGLGKGEFVIWPVKINGVHGLAFVKTDDPKAVGTSHAEPEDGQIELGAGDSAVYFGNAESAMVLADRLQYVISLMAGSDAAPVPAVAAPAVPDDRVSQDDAALMQAASALALYRAGESAEYMAKAIEAMLQSAPTGEPK